MHNFPEKKDFENFFFNFYGYGNLNSNIWFIGIEEGSVSNSVEELIKRIAVWKDMGEEKILDCKEFHLKLGMGNEKPFITGSIQATWGRYIDLIHRLRNFNKITKEEKRRYQLNNFATRESDHCLLELFPIPCRNINSWPYADLIEIIEFFKDKKLFQEFVVNKRIENIQKLIEKYQPRLVIFNSSGVKESLISYWEQIINSKLEKIIIDTANGSDFYFKNTNFQTKFYSLHNLKYEPDEVKSSIVDHFKKNSTKSI